MEEEGEVCEVKVARESIRHNPSGMCRVLIKDNPHVGPDGTEYHSIYMMRECDLGEINSWIHEFIEDAIASLLIDQGLEEKYLDNVKLGGIPFTIPHGLTSLVWQSKHMIRTKGFLRDKKIAGVVTPEEVTRWWSKKVERKRS